MKKVIRLTESDLVRLVKKAIKEQEMNEIAMIIGALFFSLFILFWGVYELVDFCATTRRCGR